MRAQLLTLLVLLGLSGCGSDKGSVDGSSRGADTASGDAGGPGGGGPGGGGPGGGGPGGDGPGASGDTGSTDDTAGSDGGPGGSAGGDTAPAMEPPLGGTSGGSGGADHPSSAALSAAGSDYLLLAPSGSASRSALCFLLVYSGTEGASVMMSNMRQVAPYYGLGDCLIAVLDGTRSGAADGASVLDAVRTDYDVDNDRTWLLSESAGTGAGLELGLHTRQSYFAAYWANDVNDADTPRLSAEELGFAPWGCAGPGGDLPDANAIVDGMRAAGYRLPADAPYSGPGADTHGSVDQFLAAVSFFSDKRRE